MSSRMRFDEALASMPGLDAGRLRTDVERLAALGPRFPGGAGELRARDLLLGELEEAGLEDVGSEEFEYLSYEPIASSARISGGDAALPCVGLQGTAAAVARGAAVYVAGGEAEDLAAVEAAGVALAGRIVVLRSAVPGAVAGALVERGAAGLILLSPTPDGLIGHFTASFHPQPERAADAAVLPIPGVTVEAAAGERLLGRLSAGETAVEISHDAVYRVRTSVNVRGELPGAAAPEQRIVIGAHYDTQYDSPGAADNGSGLAALLATARAWRGLRTRRTVAFVAFGCEELGCWGARAYVRTRAAAPPRAMVNLDALGPPVRAKRTIVADPRLAAFAAESARRAGWEVEQELDARDFPFADHAPFVDAGIPACWIWRYPPPHPYYHSAGDTSRWVDCGLLAEDARAAAYTTYRLAQAETIPGQG